MSHRLVAIVSLALLLAVAGTASAQVAGAPADLPISRVVLFTSGVGYFERSGNVSGGSRVQMSFKTEDINDILKSMVIMGAPQASVTYAPRDPVSKALRSFAVDITDDPTLGQLLSQLRGAKVRINVPPRTYEGAVLGVERRTKDLGDGQTVTVDVLNVIGTDGLVSVELPEVKGLELLDADLKNELGRALAVLAGARDKNKKPVTIHVGGNGMQDVAVGYIVETPVWKTSYRLVLDDQEKPLLQGWAIVENTSDADWSDVRLSLVSGQPISFVQDLYTPYYVRRQVVEPERYATLKAKAYEAKVADYLSDDKAPAAPMEAQSRGRAMRKAVGRAGGSLAFAADEKADFDGLRRSALHEAAKKQMAATSGAGALAELFEYPIAGKVTLERQQSAMFLIVNGEVDAERMSIYDPSVHAKFPLSGLEMSNSTGLYLMQGPITVFDSGVYAGDARITDVPTDDKRLVTYALDQKREVVVRRPSRDTELVSLKIIRGVLVVTRKYERETQYLVTNKDAEKRTVLIQHPYDASWELVEPKDQKPATATEYRFRVEVPGRKGDNPGGERLEVVEQRTVDQHVGIASESPNTLRVYMRSNKARPELVKALEIVLAHKAEIAGHQQSVSRKQQEVREITADQDRTRENMKVLGSGNPMYDTYLKKWQEQEQRLETLRSEIKKLQETIDQLQKDLNREIAGMNIG